MSRCGTASCLKKGDLFRKQGTATALRYRVTSVVKQITVSGEGSSVVAVHGQLIAGGWTKPPQPDQLVLKADERIVFIEV